MNPTKLISLSSPYAVALALLCGTSSLALAASSKSTVLNDWPHIKSAIAKDPVMEARIQKIVAGMSLAQKVGQMTQPEIKFATPQDVSKYYLGSVLNGGGTWPQMNKHAKAADWVALADQYYAASMATDMATKVPVIWGIDAIHGNSNVYGATLYPHNIGLGAAHNTKLIAKIAVEVGKSVRATGINWVFAPTLAVGRDARWGRSYESFSEDGAQVKSYAAAYVKGLQGSFKDDKNVVATAKHFIGDGGTFHGVDRGVNQSTLAQMMNQQAQGYYGAFAAGAQTVMASYNSWNDVAARKNYGKMHGNKTLLTEVLKDKMGFDGFVVSDWDGIAEVPGCSNDSCPQAINAGIDMVMVPDNWKSFIANTVAQVERGEIPLARIDDAVTRILRVKMRANLFDKKPSDNVYAGKQGALLARDLARQAVRESLVLLKNNDHVLPLKRDQKILVVGKSADSMINQSGGWSLTWQGTENKEADYQHGDTILSGIKEAAGAINVHYSRTGEDVDVAQFDTVVAVIGETPYAEGFGDIAPSIPLSHSVRHPEDLAVLKAVSGKGKPVVTVLVTGRAMYSNDLFNLSDSVVAAWLPGSEGKGVTDVLFRDPKGKVSHDFKGSLPFSWPNVSCLSAAISQAPTASKERLFSLGYGLKYRAAKNMAALLEEAPQSQCGSQPILTISNANDRSSFPQAITSAGRKITVGVSMPDHGSSATVRASQVAMGNHATATQVSWTGAGRFEATAAFATAIPANVVVDGVLQFDTQVMQAPSAKVILAMDCGDNCVASVELTEVFRGMAGKAMQTLRIPLQCFIAKGVNPRKIKTPFSIATDAAFIASFDEVQMRAGGAKDSDALACGALR